VALDEAETASLWPGVGEIHSTAEAGQRWRREGASLQGALEEGKWEGIGVSLVTPERIQSLQKKLYIAAKANEASSAHTECLAAISSSGDLLRLRRTQAPPPEERPLAVCCYVKSVGEPDALDTHVRFDERGPETEPYATAPVLDSTQPSRTAAAQALFRAEMRRPKPEARGLKPVAHVHVYVHVDRGEWVCENARRGLPGSSSMKPLSLAEASSDLARELGKLPPFQSFSRVQLATLAACARAWKGEPGDVILDDGDTGQDPYLLLSGAAKVCRATPVGEVCIAQLEPGDIFGEISFLDGEPRSGQVLGVEPGTVLQFAIEPLRRAMDSNPFLAAAVLRAFWQALAIKIRKANQAMTSIMAASPEKHQPGEGEEGESAPLSAATKRRVLRQIGLSSEELDAMAGQLQARRYAPNSLIFGEGELGDELFVLLEGQVRISRKIPGMGEEAIAILKRGEVFGEMALVDDRPRSADAWAHAGGCAVLAITDRYIEECLSQAPDKSIQFLRTLCGVLCKRLRNMTEMLVAWRVMAGFV